MSDILTITLNPALDVSGCTHHVEHTRKLRCDQVHRHPGGGGVNVARVLHRLGADCSAMCMVGGPSGQMLLSLMLEEGVPCVPVAVGGHTRESFTVLDLANLQEYRFVLPGPDVHADEWKAMLALLAWQAPSRYVVISGSLPPGVPQDAYAQLASAVSSWGAQLVIDGSGPSLVSALGHGVYLAKPSLRELRELTALPLTNLEEVGVAATQLVKQKKAQVVAVSLGEKGALMATDEGVVYAPPLAINVLSAVGAGDSFVGGMVWSLSRGEDLRQAFAYGVAAGSAALLNKGTGLAYPEDVHQLVQNVLQTGDLALVDL